MLGLKDEADLAIPKPRQLQCRQRRQVLAVEPNLSRGGRVEPAQAMKQRALARARGAAQREEFAARYLEIHVAQHFQRPFADPISFPDAARNHQWPVTVPGIGFTASAGLMLSACLQPCLTHNAARPQV